MSIYSQVESGTKAFRSRFHKSISYSKRYDCKFAQLVPVLAKFVLPGDVWRIGGNVLVRFQPMRTPSLTPNYFKVRYFFVPLRLIESNTELILTGSKDGHLYTGTLPEFKNFVADANKITFPNAYKVQKYGFWDYMGVQTGNYESIKTNKCLPARYWYKAYQRIIWDYYYDENITLQHGAGDFETYFNTEIPKGVDVGTANAELKKDYFVSSLPWQLKGTAPVLDVTGTASFTPNYTGAWIGGTSGSASADFNTNADSTNVFLSPGAEQADLLNTKIKNLLNQTQSVSLSGLGFTADDLRTMMAQTRIFERLARTGSRYTEYLRANFGTSPADGTLQRAQYLGGWSLPIITTEVLQTAEDGSTPVGTMRGHGITNGGNRINTFYAKEFGLIFGIAHIMPQTEYTTGIPKELTYKKRFDFFNPSLQHLSEQEVKNGELFISETDGKNDDTFGFQAYGNELRSSINQTVGDLRDSLSDWTQSLHFTSRPNLNQSFITGSSHLASFNAPFAVSDLSARPCIVDFYNDLDVYRPMVRYSTPGLVDHL